MISFLDLYTAYEMTKQNKPKSADTITFEIDKEVNLIKLYEDINNRTLKADQNYAFVVFKPKPREIFATYMGTRIVHHYIDWKMRDILERVLSPYSFNNRIGKGQHKAIETYRELIKEETNNYTEDAWLIHLDFKGYFPNADVEVAYKQNLDLIEKYYNSADKEDLKYMLDVVMHADPARHCKVYNKGDWKYIKEEKSLFSKPKGIGAAIGFLCWQNAMGLYVNDEIKWLNEELGFKLVIFVDDIYVVTKEKERFLSILPELRQRLALKKVKLNENKFYCQHYTKGIHCLGTRLKFDRKYIDNNTFKRALAKIDELNKKEIDIEKVLCSLNSYTGMLKNCNNLDKLEYFVYKALDCFKDVIYWNEEKKCFRAKVKYKIRLKQKYHFLSI